MNLLAQKAKVAVATFLALILLDAGCGRPAASNPPAPGVFQGAYLGYSESITLKSDGTFSQRLTFANTTYSNSGSWSFEFRRMQGKIAFRPYLSAVNTSVLPPRAQIPPVKYGFYEGDWIAGRDQIHLTSENGIFVQRTSN